MLLTVIIPVLNEEKTLERILKKVLLQKEVGEIIVVDDGSTDQTLRILDSFADPKIKVLKHQKNLGKGAAIQTGLKKARGKFIIFQDADLEYNPGEYKKLLKYTDGEQVVYGSRILNNNPHAYARTYLGNVLITQVANILFGINLTDSYTCYKLIPTKIAKSLGISSQGFEVEAEITAKLAKKRHKIIEVPISYKPRSYQQGKKIKAMDALKGTLTFLKIRFGRN